MNAALYIAAILAIGCLTSCGRPVSAKIAPIPEQTPEPIVTTQVPPTPVAAAAETQARLAPDGILYVIKSFNVTTDDGIQGFPEGKKVTLVREEMGEYLVSDGHFQGRASVDSFTKDLDIVDGILKKQQTTAEAALVARKNSYAASQAKAYELEGQRQENVKAAQTAKIRAQIQQLDINIASASQSLQEVYRAKARGGNIYDQFGNKIGTRVSSASGNAFQLKQSIKGWQQQKAALQKELNSFR